MLRIVRDDKGPQVILIVEGRIVTEWADLLEEECLDLIRSGYRVVLDLSSVVFIDRQGIAVLRRLSGAGVEIRGCSALIADMLEDEGLKVSRRKWDMNDRVVPWRGRKGDDA